MAARYARSILWLGIVVAAYLVFWTWYGGAGRPVTPAEGAALLDRIAAQRAPAARAGYPEFRHNVEALIARDDGREFVMVNLETLAEGAEAQAAGQAYTKAVLPALLKRGGFPIFVGEPRGLVLGAREGSVNRVALVRYRSLRDLLHMTLDPLMTQGTPHKFASLRHTEVFPVSPAFSAFNARLLVGLLGVVVALGGLMTFAAPRRVPVSEKSKRT